MADTCTCMKLATAFKVPHLLKTTPPPPSHIPPPHLEVGDGGPDSRQGSSGSSTELGEQLQCCVGVSGECVCVVWE